MRGLLFLVFPLLCFSFKADAQTIRSLKHEISSLCAPAMAGRGYVAKGHQNAAKHIMRKFRDMGLKPISADSSFYQTYTFPVVTFPDSVMVTIKKRELVSGEEFLVDAASSSYRANKQKVQKVNVGHYADTSDWVTQKRYFNEQKIYLLEGTDSLCRLLKIRPSQLAAQLPKSCFIIPIKGKMTWTVSTKLIPATVLYIQDSVLPKRLRKMSLGIHSELIPADENANVIAMQRGTEVPDSFIAITAHYDHLGRMGWDATFPGASDNASGTAMMLQLAAYYAKNPQKYSMLFIGFSGEEAGLLGSRFFVEHPLVPLSQIRFLVNLDIMGNAENGITVVNGSVHTQEFELLKSLNKPTAYLPQILPRGRAANSDHYPFSEAGVPAFFIYSNGGAGYYHDVFDRVAELKLTNIDKVMDLLKSFVKAMQ